MDIAKEFEALGFHIVSTKGTYSAFVKSGISNIEEINKITEDSPNISDVIDERGIQMVVNTPSGKGSATAGSYIRKSAVKNKICYMTTLAAAKAALKGIAAAKTDDIKSVKSLQKYQEEL